MSSSHFAEVEAPKLRVPETVAAPAPDAPCLEGNTEGPGSASARGLRAMKRIEVVARVKVD